MLCLHISYRFHPPLAGSDAVAARAGTAKTLPGPESPTLPLRGRVKSDEALWYIIKQTLNAAFREDRRYFASCFSSFFSSSGGGSGQEAIFFPSGAFPPSTFVPRNEAT